MQEVRQKTELLFVLEEIWADINSTFWMSWHGPGIQRMMATVSRTCRLITDHIGSKAAYLLG
jgi:hypothetical protein